MAFNTKVDVADTELEADETVAAEAEDVTLEDEALVEAESDADEDDEEADEEAGRVRGLADLFQRCDREDRRHGHPRGAARPGHEG